MAVRSLIIAFLLLSLCVASAYAQSGPQTTQSVVAGGGGASASGSLQAEVTAGQSVTGASEGGAFKVESGFWPGAAAQALANLSVNNLSATYGGTLSLKATLSATGANVSGKSIKFSLNGTNVGAATTDAQGLATLNNISLGGIDAGTYANGISAEFAGDVELTAGNGKGQLMVLKADPVLAVNGGSFTYDGQPHPANASATGVNNETLSPVSLLYNGASNIPVNAGSYTVTATFAGNLNYNSATNSQQSVIISTANQAITFAALSNKTFGDADFTLSATASSLLGVSFAATGQCTVTGSTVHITATGSCTITASQGGNSNFNAATPVSHTFSIGQATATVTLNNLTQSYDGSAKSPTAQTNPSGLAVTFTYTQNSAPVTSPTNVGNYNVTATINNPNYQGSTTGILVINKAVPVITWNNPSSIIYGTPLGSTQLNAAANVPGTFTYAPPAGSVLNVGSHQLSAAFTPSDAANYTTANLSAQITVDPVTAPVFNFDNATYSVNEGDGHATVTVNRTGNTAGAATVSYATSDTAALTNCNVTNGIASSRCDYTTSVGILRFAAGESSRTISIPLVDDDYAEGNESFSITLSNALGEDLGAVSTANITIKDNETAAGQNPLSSNAFFVRQHYMDFLGRDPEPKGLADWLAILSNCATGDAKCDRIEVSAGFFRSAEFQERGYFTYRFYSASLGRKPDYNEFIPDMAKVSGFLTDAEKEANKVAFVQEFMQRAEFKNRYDSQTTPTAYVDALLNTAGLQNHPSRAGWIEGLTNNTLTRAQVLRQLAESAEVYRKFYNQAFVVEEYFGYLRRDPDALYLQWIDKLDKTGDYRALIDNFLSSTEYRMRFGP
jgi:hypothetical protein